MNPNLQEQHDAFKKTMLRQTFIQRPTSTPSPSPSASGNRPNSERPVTFDEIHSNLNINLTAQPDLLDKVLRNERISHDGEFLRYHATYSIRSEEDIVILLKQRTNMAGIDLAELKEANPRAEELTIELAKRREIFSIRPREDGPKILFYNDYKISRPIDDDFKQLWMNTPVPSDEFDLRSAIEKAGMKPHSQGLVSLIPPNMPSVVEKQKKKPTAKRSFRKIKITNDYLDNIDLNLDPNTL